MTLREGIELILMKPIYSDKAIDEILKLFEKLINEKIDSIRNISLDENIIQIDCLEELKEELKK